MALRLRQRTPPRESDRYPIRVGAEIDGGIGRERHGELVADLASQGAWLGELQVMRISRCLLTNQTALAANVTNQTALAANESEVILAASSGWLVREGKTGLLSGRAVGGCANVA